MVDYPLPTELRGQPPPPEDDSISFALWVDANLCKECDGLGEVWCGQDPDSDDEDDFDECDACEGRGHFAPGYDDYF